jgi:hypothetical protein
MLFFECQELFMENYGLFVNILSKKTDLRRTANGKVCALWRRGGRRLVFASFFFFRQGCLAVHLWGNTLAKRRKNGGMRDDPRSAKADAGDPHR